MIKLFALIGLTMQLRRTNTSIYLATTMNKVINLYHVTAFHTRFQGRFKSRYAAVISISENELLVQCITTSSISLPELYGKLSWSNIKDGARPPRDVTNSHFFASQISSQELIPPQIMKLVSLFLSSTLFLAAYAAPTTPSADTLDILKRSWQTCSIVSNDGPVHCRWDASTKSRNHADLPDGVEYLYSCYKEGECYKGNW